jgi:uncharacterized protein YcfJ
MRKIVVFSTLAAIAGLAAAQEQGRVISSTPIVQQVAVPQQVCGTETYATAPQPTGGGAVLGALAGGAVGNTIGRGNGRAAATALGVVGGALIGNQVESNGARPQYQTVERCQNQTRYENRTVGYNVTYEYAGRQYTMQTATRPGAYVPVQVSPADTYGQAPAYSQPGYVVPAVTPPAVYSPPAYYAPPPPPPVTIEYGVDYYPYRHHHYYGR